MNWLLRSRGRCDVPKSGKQNSRETGLRPVTSVRIEDMAVVIATVGDKRVVVNDGTEQTMMI